MITNKDIRIAVNQQLAKTGVRITSRDVQEGFDRPSFFVQLDNVGRSGSETQIEKMMTVRIYYFPSDRYEYAVEVLDMQDTLENLFDLKLKVGDRYLNTMEFNSYVTDGVLQCSFDLEFQDGRMERETVDGVYPIEKGQYPIEKMYELDINKE